MTRFHEQASASVSLAQYSQPAAGEIRSCGFTFRVLPDAESVALVGWYGETLESDIVIPSCVSSGSDSYAVTIIGDPAKQNLFEGAPIESISIPASVETILDGAFSGCSSLSYITVSLDNENYASYDGMLFSKDLSNLLFTPEGKKGVAYIPSQTVLVAAEVFSQCSGLISVEVEKSSVAFSSWNGILYSKNRENLVACPPGVGVSAVIATQTHAIAPGAFSGCSLTSIIVLGDLNEISPEAFDNASKDTVVALVGSEGHQEARGIWEDAGFSRFSNSALPGDLSLQGRFKESDSTAENKGLTSYGLSFTLLDDYTLSVSWMGPGEPADDLIIPASAQVGSVSYRVSSIAPRGFAGLLSLESLKLPEGIALIGEGAFAGCSNLASIEFSQGLMEIGERAFEATALAEVWIPDSVVAIKSRAFASCNLLTRVVTLGSPEVAVDAFVECSNVSLYCPQGSEEVWKSTELTAGSTVQPFGIELAKESLILMVGEEGDLFEGAFLELPENVEIIYSYAAAPLSIDAGTTRGKAQGSTDVVVTLALDGIEIARSSRFVEVLPSSQATTETISVRNSSLLPSAYLISARAVQLSVTAPVVVTFGDGEGYDVANPTASVTSSSQFENYSDFPVAMESLTCVDAGATEVLEAKADASDITAQNLFSLYPKKDDSKAISFGLGPTVSSVQPGQGDFVIASNSSLECTYRLNLNNASVKVGAADYGMSVKPLATVSYMFKRDGGGGTEEDVFYLKDSKSGVVYSIADVKTHANSIAEYGSESPYYLMYAEYLADETAYECKTVWNKVAYDVRLVGINHDILTTPVDRRTKAGLTFQFVNLLESIYPMNGSNSNSGGWGSSALHASMNDGEIWDMVPSELRDALVQVEKSYGSESTSTSSSVSVSHDTLFLMTYYEYTGAVFDGWSKYRWVTEEGYRYEYYQNKPIQTSGPNSLMEKGKQLTPDDNTSWWMRSVRPNFPGDFMGVYINGDLGLSGTRSASTPCGVCPCFCF